MLECLMDQAANQAKPQGQILGIPPQSPDVTQTPATTTSSFSHGGTTDRRATVETEAQLVGALRALTQEGGAHTQFWHACDRLNIAINNNISGNESLDFRFLGTNVSSGDAIAIMTGDKIGLKGELGNNLAQLPTIMSLEDFPDSDVLKYFSRFFSSPSQYSELQHNLTPSQRTASGVQGTETVLEAYQRFHRQITAFCDANAQVLPSDQVAILRDNLKSYEDNFCSILAVLEKVNLRQSQLSPG